MTWGTSLPRRGAWIAALAVLAVPATLGQTTPPPTSQNSRPAGQTRKPPAFSAAGAQGSTAPSGYATGISREETSAANQGADALGHELLLAYIPDWSVPGCGLEAGLVKAANADPQSYEAIHAIGLFYLEHADFRRSVSYLESALRLRPDSSGDRYAVVLGLLGEGKFPEAVAFLQSGLGDSTKDAALLRLLALAYQLSGEQRRARDAYQAAIQASPRDPHNLLSAGLGLINAGGHQQAAELFRSATASFPKEADIWLGLGIAQEMGRQKPEAVASLLRAVALDRSLAPAYFFLAALADAAPESATAIRMRLAEFVVAHPSSAEGHYNYALALWMQRRIDPEHAADSEIEAQLKLALGGAPKMARAHSLLGMLYSDRGDLAEAESELSQAVALEPGDAEGHYRLAQNYKRRHNLLLADRETHEFLSLQGRGAPEEQPRTEASAGGRVGDPIAALSAAPPCDALPQR